MDLLFLIWPLTNVITSFSDATFTGLVLKSSSINFTTNDEAAWCLSPVNPITYSYILVCKDSLRAVSDKYDEFPTLLDILIFAIFQEHFSRNKI